MTTEERLDRLEKKIELIEQRQQNIGNHLKTIFSALDEINSRAARAHEIASNAESYFTPIK